MSTLQRSQLVREANCGKKWKMSQPAPPRIEHKKIGTLEDMTSAEVLTGRVPIFRNTGAHRSLEVAATQMCKIRYKNMVFLRPVFEEETHSECTRSRKYANIPLVVDTFDAFNCRQYLEHRAA